MKWLKNPMANAVYVALITAIYAAIFIVSSEFVMSYENLLSDSGNNTTVKRPLNRKTFSNKTI